MNARHGFAPTVLAIALVLVASGCGTPSFEHRAPSGLSGEVNADSVTLRWHGPPPAVNVETFINAFYVYGRATSLVSATNAQLVSAQLIARPPWDEFATIPWPSSSDSGFYFSVRADWSSVEGETLSAASNEIFLHR